MNSNNRYQTPFEDIVPIKFASWCQKSRAKAAWLLQMFMAAQDHPLRVSFPERECQGKKWYGSNAAAAAAIMGRKESTSRRGGDMISLIGLHPYKCTNPDCGGWHIGHRPGSKEKINRIREERRNEK